MKKRIIIMVWAILLILNIGCNENPLNQDHQDNTIPIVLDREAAKEAYLTARKQNDGPITYDEILADIALEVPGYGGHFFDEEGVLNVYLLDDEEQEAFKTALSRQSVAGILAELDTNRLANLRTRQGRYNFLQLYNWRIALRRDVLGIKGVTMLYINEAQNNITIGVEDLAYKEEVLKKIRQMKLPEVAINVIKQESMRYYIREKRKTLAGGLRIQYIAGSTRECTLGPVAQRNGVKGFIINSHCTANQFSVDFQKIYQAKTSDRQIATETVNPPAFTGGACPAGRICAYADAAFATWENRGTWNLGKIYETEYKDPVSGSTKRVGANFIIAGGGYPEMGRHVEKVGMASGWTYGSVTATCVDVQVDGTNTNITMLCQFIASAGATGGDSGSPVFSWRAPLLPDHVFLWGILWGGNGQSMVFSPKPSIADHLGGTINFY